SSPASDSHTRHRAQSPPRPPHSHNCLSFLPRADLPSIRRSLLHALPQPRHPSCRFAICYHADPPAILIYVRRFTVDPPLPPRSAAAEASSLPISVLRSNAVVAFSSPIRRRLAISLIGRRQGILFFADPLPPRILLAEPPPSTPRWSRPLQNHLHRIKSNHTILRSLTPPTVDLPTPHAADRGWNVQKSTSPAVLHASWTLIL
uniref:Uncharacterized protein n=1 Tax=Leersia perrieri TaxID=77586 RepID=A0A0D9VVG5_9ORYZ